MNIQWFLVYPNICFSMQLNILEGVKIITFDFRCLTLFIRLLLLFREKPQDLYLDTEVLFAFHPKTVTDL